MILVRALPVALAALLVWPALALAEAPAEYRRAVAETVRAGEEAASVLPPNVPLAEHLPLNAAIARLESITQVTTESGNRVAVDNRDALRRLRGSRDEGRRAYDSLVQLGKALDTSADQNEGMGGSHARAALDEVLSRPDFRKHAPNPVGQFIEDIRIRFSRWLTGVIPRIDFLPGVTDALVQALGLLFFLLLGAATVFAIVFGFLTWRSSRQNTARYAALRSAVRNDLQDARAARLEAQRCADQGDYRTAVHYVLLWAILHLAEQSQLRYDHSLTNREQVRALGAEGDVAGLLQAAVETFDRIWYGHATCTATEYSQFRGTVERIVGTTT